MRLPRVRFTVKQMMIVVALCAGSLVLLRVPASVLFVVVVSSGAYGAILASILIDRARGGLGIKGGLVAGCGTLAVLFCLLSPRSTWYGAKPVNLTFLIVDGRSGSPITGAEVELIHSFDDERPPVKGQTDADGRVVLRNLFPACGVNYLLDGTEHVSFRDFVIHVSGEGFSEFRACLGPPDDLPNSPRTTAPPLRMTYPVSGPVKIRLIRSGGDVRGASTAEPKCESSCASGGLLTRVVMPRDADQYSHSLETPRRPG
jgi:hypothetical protein